MVRAGRPSIGARQVKRLMHELSIAGSLVDVALDALPPEPGRVGAVYLRLGVLAGVDEQALQFGYDLVTAGTPLEGSRLMVEHVPVSFHCPNCHADVQPESAARLRCPGCGRPAGALLGGRDLQLSALDFTPDPAPPGGPS